MSLSQKIAAALANQPAHDSSMQVDDGPYRLVIDLRRASAVGVEAGSIEFFHARSSPAERSLDELRTWADRLAARVTYLTEPLVVLEADAVGVEVELRSRPTAPRDGTQSYFEAILNRHGRLGITRQGYDVSTRQRAPIPFQLTADVLARLADDLVDTAG